MSASTSGSLRVATFIAARPSSVPDGRQEMCTCVNISADGHADALERGLEIGDLVVFRMPIVGRIAAKVVWSIGGKIGAQFDKSISVEDYLPMIRAMGAERRRNQARARQRRR